MTKRREVLKNTCVDYPNGFEFFPFLLDKFIKKIINPSQEKAEKALSSFNNHFALFNK